MEYALRAKEFQESINIYTVLILVLMEYALRVDADDLLEASLAVS